MADNSISRTGFSLLALATVAALCGPLAGAAEAPAASGQTIYLDYTEAPTYVTGASLDITPHPVPFRQEPNWGGRHVCRGTVDSASHGARQPGALPTHAINLPFLWDYTEGKLYLDLNRNGDLTDDPVLSAKPSQGNYSYQSFTNLHIALSPKPGPHPVAVDLNFYGYTGRELSGATLLLHSYWQGKMVLHGQEYQVGLIEHPAHLGSTEQAFLLLRPWDERAKVFNTQDGLLSGCDFCTNLFACGQAHCLGCAYVPGDPPKFRLELTEAQAELGELELTGKSIRRAVLREHQAKLPYTVLLDRPAQRVKVPLGTYNKYWAALKEKDTEAFCDYRDWLKAPPLTVSSTKPAILRIGGPLTNSVSVKQEGRTLSFDYQLQGAGGRYRLAGPINQSHPPQLTIYQKGQAVGDANFQYG
jgi:hypothetical protein